MSDKKILCCNIGWMARYKGQKGQQDDIVGGGIRVTENKYGNEVCNFLDCSDHVYGHVETFINGTKKKLRLKGSVPVIRRIT